MPGRIPEARRAPTSRLWVAISGCGGQFSDGYILGIVGITLSSATSALGLTALWLAALSAASLCGLFLGALAAGAIVDRYGRRPVFAWDMVLFAILSALQFFVTSATQLLALRVLLGLILGADYVAAKALVMECSGEQGRGRLLSLLAFGWAAGYGSAYCVGFALRDVGSDSWRWMLLSSSIPAAAIAPFRFRVGESLIWKAQSRSSTPRSSWRLLFTRTLRRRSAVACLFYTCQVIPFFALSTFVPLVLGALDVHDSYGAGLIYSLFLLVGSALGLAVVDRLSRRVFLVGSFYACALVLAVLTVWTDMPPALSVSVFALFSAILAAAVNLEYVYPPELFPTPLRGAGVGLAVAASRIGAASGTFLLPLVEQRFGVQVALGACVLVLVSGGVGCQLWAPETRGAI